MQFLYLFSLSSLLFSVVAASPSAHHHRSVAAHAAIAKRQQLNSSTPLKRRASSKCRPKSNSNPTPAASKPKSTPKPKPAYKPTPASSPKAAPTHNSSGSKGGSNNDITPINVNGLLKIEVARCGPNGAQKSTSATRGPNGSIDFLNCGITGSGWNPPYMTMDDIVTVDLADAVNQANSPFKQCQPYLWAFQQFGNQYGIEPIILASFALQESSCNPHTVGGAGEQGLMQLTKDKCTRAPNGNCQDVGYNVGTAAKYFSDTYNGNNKDLLKSIGEYNGWYQGITIGKATAAGNGPCCRCQNNLDYLFQFLNGWVLNIDAYDHSPRLGKYFNLDKCGHNY